MGDEPSDSRSTLSRRQRIATIAAAATLSLLAVASLTAGIAAAVARSSAWTTAAGAWFGGSATASAFFVAFWVQRRDRLAAAQASERERSRVEQRAQAAEDARRLQAELVRVHAVLGGQKDVVINEAHVTVTNNADQPVFDVAVRLGYGPGQWSLNDIGAQRSADITITHFQRPWGTDGQIPVTIDYTLGERRWSRVGTGPAMPGAWAERGYQMRWPHPDHVPNDFDPAD